MSGCLKTKPRMILKNAERKIKLLSSEQNVTLGFFAFQLTGTMTFRTNKVSEKEKRDGQNPKEDVGRVISIF